MVPSPGPGVLSFRTFLVSHWMFCLSLSFNDNNNNNTFYLFYFIFYFYFSVLFLKILWIVFCYNLAYPL